MSRDPSGGRIAGLLDELITTGRVAIVDTDDQEVPVLWVGYNVAQSRIVVRVGGPMGAGRPLDGPASRGVVGGPERPGGTQPAG